MICHYLALRKNECGQALVEFALILPLLLMLLLGIIQFGFIFNGQITLTSAAREGARLAVVNSDDSLVESKVEEAAVALLLNTNDTIIDRDKGEDQLSVTVNGSVDIVVPFLGLVVGDAFELSSESVMRIEGEI